MAQVLSLYIKKSLRWLLMGCFLLCSLFAEAYIHAPGLHLGEIAGLKIEKQETITLSPPVSAADKTRVGLVLLRRGVGLSSAEGLSYFTVKELSGRGGKAWQGFSKKCTAALESSGSRRLKQSTDGNKVKFNFVEQAGLFGGEPSVLIDSGMGLFEAEVGQQQTQYYFLDGFNFMQGDIFTVEVNDPSGSFSISTDSGSGFGSIIEITVGSDNGFSEIIWVKYAPTAAGGHSATINHSGGGATAQALTVDGNATSLPVEWLSFTGRVREGNIILDWVTASEKNNAFFELEMSENPLLGFRKIGRIYSKENYSQTPTSYSFAYYPGGLVGTRYFRLKQVDFDKAFEYSRILAVEMTAAGGLQVVVAPNPITYSSELNIAVADAGVLNVLVLTMSGTTVCSKTFAMEAGPNKIQLHLKDKMPPGVYMLCAEFKGRFSRLKLIKE